MRSLSYHATAAGGCNSVADALLDTQHVPAPTRELLASFLAFSLGAPPAERQAFQGDAVVQIHAALVSVELGLRQSVAEQRAMVAASGAECTRRDAASESAESAIAAGRAEIETSKAMLETSTLVMKEKAKELAAAVAAEKEANKPLDEVGVKKTKLEDAMKNILEPLVNGSVFGTAKVKQIARGLVTIGKQCEFDVALLLPLPEALAIPPKRRSSIDTMYIKAFEAQLETAIAECDQTVTEGLPGREERSAAVRSAQVTHDAARERQQVCLRTIVNAQEQTKDAEAALRVAREAVRAFQSDLSTVEERLEGASRRRTAFQEGPFAVFEALRDGRRVGQEREEEAELMSRF